MSEKSSRSREEEELRAQLDALLMDGAQEPGNAGEETSVSAQEEAPAQKEELQAGENSVEEESQPKENPVEEEPQPKENPVEEEPQPEEASREENLPKRHKPAASGTRKRLNILYDIILVAGVLMLIGGGIYIVRKYVLEKKSSELYSDLENQFVTAYNTESLDEKDLLVSNWVWSSAAGDADGTSNGTIWYRKVKVDLKGLQKVNSDVAGWIFFENEQISYPIMYSGDSSYLYADMYKSYSTPGSLFLQGDNTPDFEDSLSVIYGHNMRNGTMFGKLKQYREDETYYQDHQYFQIFVGDKVYRYRVFAYFRIGEKEVDMVNVNFTDQVEPELLYSTYLAKMEAWEAEQKEREEEKQKAREQAEAKRRAEAAEAKRLYGIPEEVYLEQHPLEEEEEEEVEEDTEWMDLDYIQTDYTFQEYLDQISERTMIDTGIEVTTEDKIAALFTCSVHGDGKRFIVYGVRVDEHDFSQVEEEEAAVEFLDR